MNDFHPDQYRALRDHLWSKPDYYFGYSPDGHIVVATFHRDGNLLDESNWHCAIRELERVNGAPAAEDTVVAPLYTWRARSSMVGHVDYLMVDPYLASNDLLQAADEILCAISEYPILDEMDYSQRQSDAIVQFWEDCGLKDRIHYCSEAGVSILAARRDDIEQAVYERLHDIIY